MGLKFDLAAIVFVGEPNSRGTVQRLSHVSARLFYSSEREGFEERKRRPEISISVFFFFFFFSLSLNCDSFFSLFLFLFSIFFFPSVNVMFPFEMVHPLLLFFVRDPPSFACSRTMSSHSTMFPFGTIKRRISTLAVAREDVELGSSISEGVPGWSTGKVRSPR